MVCPKHSSVYSVGAALAQAVPPRRGSCQMNRAPNLVSCIQISNRQLKKTRSR